MKTANERAASLPLENKPSFNIQELSITLFAGELEPGTIHPAVLQYLGIIPAQWELVENPIHSDRELKLVFTNQVRLTIQSNRIIFAETVGQKQIQDIQIIQIASAYVKTFSHIKYRGISINPSGYVPFDSHKNASKYIVENLVPSQPWKTFEDDRLSAVSLKLAYPYKSGNFYLEINQAQIEIRRQLLAAVWFAGNFNYVLEGASDREKLQHLQTLVSQWKTDVNKFRSFISNKFLNTFKTPPVSVFPLE